MKSLRIPFLAFSILAFSALSTYAAQLSSAKVTAVEGTVSKYSTDGSNTALTVGEILVVGDSVSVTAMSSATLVFSNGSVIEIDENTSISIAEFQQEPFPGNQTYEQLEADPSKSQVLLELNYGELDGHVKKLRPGSTFDIQTVIGTAAIRGTKFNMRLFYNVERGEFILVVKNEDGKVDIISRYLGNFEYDNLQGDKRYMHQLDEETKEPVPMGHTVVLRINKNDPYYDELYDIMKNRIPTDPVGLIELPLPVFTPDDPGVIVVSPEDQGTN